MSAYDKLESRNAGAAEAALFAKLRELLPAATQNAPALARQLEGVDIASLQSPADLARVPVLRKSELEAMQEAAPPSAGSLRRSPGF